MIKKCLVCGEEFVTYPSKIKLNRGKYCSKECCLIKTNVKLEENGIFSRFQKGQKPHNFKGFCIKKSENTNYKLIFCPNHPNCDRHNYVPEHRLVVEENVGRLLESNEEIHHLNYDGLDNRIENLLLVTSSEHKKLHLKDTVHKRWLPR